MYGKRIKREGEEKLFEYYKGQFKKKDWKTLEKLTRPLFILKRNFS